MRTIIIGNTRLGRTARVLFLAGFAGLAAATAGSAPAGLSPVRDDLSAEDLARVAAITAPTTDFARAEPFETMQGGAGTSRKRVDANAYSHFSANITFAEESTFKLGNGIFRKLWVSPPSSTQASDGLGPLFNARACQSCHLKDGRGHPPEGNPDATSMFLRLARQASTAEEKALVAEKAVLNFPDSVYGGQLQDLAVPGMPRGSPGMEMPDGSKDDFEVMAFSAEGRATVFSA